MQSTKITHYLNKPGPGKAEALARRGIPRGMDGLPIYGWVRLNEIIRPSGPLPISRSQFWEMVKEGRLKAYKLSERVTVFDVAAVRALLTPSNTTEPPDAV